MAITSEPAESLRANAPLAAVEEPTPLGRVVAGAAAGTIIEYYDFGIYAVLAVYLAHSFFPQSNPTLGVLLAVASTGVAFVVRPLGGMLFGMMSDTVGRKTTFMTTLFVMSGATIAMGLAPDYATLGVAAPVLIVTLRILQGLAVGGEYAAASSYVVEHSPDGKRGYYTGWLAAVNGGSLVLALLAVLVTQRSLDTAQFQAWGWRLPFLYAAGLLVIAFLVRTRLKESPLFMELRGQGRRSKTPLRQVLTDRGTFGQVMAIAFGVCTPQITSGLAGSTLALYMMQTGGSVEPSRATLLIAVGCLAWIPVTLGCGALSDRLGRKPVQTAGMLLGALGFIPLYGLLTDAAAKVSPLAYLWVVLLQVPAALIVGPAFAVITEAFATPVRTTAAAIAFSVGGVLGGFSPTVAMWLAQTTGQMKFGVLCPVTILAVGALVNRLWVREYSGRSIRADQAQT